MMSTEPDTPIHVRDFSTLRLTDSDEAGGKGANLGELVSAGLPVPPGFVLLRDGYLASMQAGGVDFEMAALHREALAYIDDSARLAKLCQRLQHLVAKAGIADRVRDQLGTATTDWGRSARLRCDHRRPERTVATHRLPG